jgi:CBS domain containing-hemolysin-like protein
VSTIFDKFRKKVKEESSLNPATNEERDEMIRGIEHLSDTIVKEVMVPRTDTVFLSLDAPAEEVLSTLVESGHSRIPVYGSTIDDVVGVIYAKDALAALVKKKNFTIATLLRRPFFVPETKKIDSLLREFKRRHVHIAVVVDEYGGTSGIVCLEDIIEEIVGEIQDEFDNEPDDIVKSDNGTWICDARVRIDELDQRLGLNLPSREFDSLAGYVFDLFGRIPSTGESISTQEATFTIVEMDGHRIISIKVKVMTNDDSRDDSSGGAGANDSIDLDKKV